MTPARGEIVLRDSSVYAPLGIVALVLAGGVAIGAGVMTDGWYSTPLIVVGVLLIGLAITIGVLNWAHGAARLRLTPRGLIHSIGDREYVLPVEAIEGIGLFRTRGGFPELSLWYDRAQIPELPKQLRPLEKQPGRLRLAIVTDEVGGMYKRQVKEIREYVQAHRLAQWRNRKG